MLVFDSYVKTQNFSKRLIGPLFSLNYDLQALFTEAIEEASFLKKLGFGRVCEEIQKYTPLFKKLIQNQFEFDFLTYFYESFLKFYNAKKRLQRGVYHTPLPLVSFIVRAIDFFLKTEFNYPKGLAEESVHILDPAAGTGLFLEEIIKQINISLNWNKNSPSNESPEDIWDTYISNSLLTKIWGFELLFPSFVLANLKIEWLLRSLTSKLQADHQLNLFLANALDYSTNLKHFHPPPQFSVVLGNPPYSRGSQNKNPSIEKLLELYKQPVRTEKNLQPLSDDYLKFLRLSQKFIETTGYGIIGLVTNHTFLTGIIHRGVRQALRNAFDLIYVIDLHGSKRIGEDVPPSKVDENIFGIKQGVCVIFLIKYEARQKSQHSPTIYYYDLIGTKNQKFEWLLTHSISSIPWMDLSEYPEDAPFIRPEKLPSDFEYIQYPKLSELFDFYNVGGKPGDDRLLVSFTPDEVEYKIKTFYNKIVQQKPLGTLTEAKRKFLRCRKKFTYNSKRIEKYLYRPFDIRWTYYDPQIWTRPVIKLKQLCKNNILLLCTRIVKDVHFAHVFVVDSFPDVIFLSNTSSVNTYVFPLLKIDSKGNRVWNFSSSYLQYLERMGFDSTKLDSIEPLAYIYAFLFSNKYRAKYSLFLKRDFPRIPLLPHCSIYDQLIALGAQLIQLHLHKIFPSYFQEIETNAKPGDKIAPTYPKFSKNRLWISPKIWFSPLSDKIWNFQIGKYAVCQTWMKYRVNRPLYSKDIEWIKKIIAILKETLQIVQEINKIELKF
ncbi:MAG: type ISP restriction/modification enzyme [Candidatus Helarchaeota archaeon]